MYGLDLFSGIGGLTKALEPWVRPVAYCENDRYAQSVLLSRMGEGELPNGPIWDDVRTLRGDMLPRVDIIYGGFPCQDISIAGRGAGLAGERSDLFFEIVRLVGEIRPRFVFLENVPAITSRGGWDVVGAIAAVGYDCRWDMLSAYDVGAPRRRERWFLLAYSQYGRVEIGWRASSVGAVGNGQSRVCESSPSRSSVQATNMVESRVIAKYSQWDREPDVGRMVNGVQFRMDRLRGLGNAVVPAQAREAFRRLMGFKRLAQEVLGL